VSDNLNQDQVWWRKEPLTDKERDLMENVLMAHHNSCYRNNPSTLAVAQAADASGDLGKAIASGILTVGAKHAPLEKTAFFLLMEHPASDVFRILKAGHRVPGWGGSFQKDGPDPIWERVADLLDAGWPEVSSKLAGVTNELHKLGKMIYPNPSAYTAAAAIVLGLGPKRAVYLFIMGRLTAWSQIAANTMQERKE
jgi:citrate synthase